MDAVHSHIRDVDITTGCGRDIVQEFCIRYLVAVADGGCGDIDLNEGVDVGGIEFAMGHGQPIGNLDGVEAFGDNAYLVTDWMAGKLLLIDKSGKVKTVLILKPGCADLAYAPEPNMALIPMMQDNKLVAYTLKP